MLRARIPSIIVFVAVVLAFAATPVRAAEPVFRVGVCTHFQQFKGAPGLNTARIADAGIAAIRDEASWGSVEREKGVYAVPGHIDAYVETARKAGLKVMMILDYANTLYDDGDRPRTPEAVEGYCRYAEFMAKHFKGRITWYEVWNEYDIGIGLPERHRKGGSPEDYTRMLKEVYPRLKKADGKAIVLAGAATSGGIKKGWLESIVKLGALDFCDAVSIHTYNYSEAFPARGPEACIEWIATVQDMLRAHNGGADVELYVTEMGWPTHAAKNGTPPVLAASYLARFHLLARTYPWFRGIWWYDFQDDGWNPKLNEDNFGIVRPDLTPKPAYQVLADITGLVSEGRFIDRLWTPDRDLAAIAFQYGRKTVWALWSSDDRERQVVLRASDPGGDLDIRELGSDPVSAPWGWHNWVGNRDAALQPDRVSLVVGARPVLVSGDLAGVTITHCVAR